MAYYIDVDEGDGEVRKRPYDGPLTPGMKVYERVQDGDNWSMEELQVNDQGQAVKPEYRYSQGNSAVEVKNINTGEWERSVRDPTDPTGQQIPISVAQERGINYENTPGLDTSGGGIFNHLSDMVMGNGDLGLLEMALGMYGAYNAGNFINNGINSLTGSGMATDIPAGYGDYGDPGNAFGGGGAFNGVDPQVFPIPEPGKVVETALPGSGAASNAGQGLKLPGAVSAIDPNMGGAQGLTTSGINNATSMGGGQGLVADAGTVFGGGATTAAISGVGGADVAGSFLGGTNPSSELLNGTVDYSPTNPGGQTNTVTDPVDTTTNTTSTNTNTDPTKTTNTTTSPTDPVMPPADPTGGSLLAELQKLFPQATFGNLAASLLDYHQRNTLGEDLTNIADKYLEASNPFKQPERQPFIGRNSPLGMQSLLESPQGFLDTDPFIQAMKKGIGEQSQANFAKSGNLPLNDIMGSAQLGEVMGNQYKDRLNLTAGLGGYTMNSQPGGAYTSTATSGAMQNAGALSGFGTLLGSNPTNQSTQNPGNSNPAGNIFQFISSLGG